MSGHSKWSSIKHKKARADAARGKIFTRVIKEITVAARMGGGDIDMNPRLRTAVQAAKGANMPAKNIENAIMKGTGELPGVVYDEVVYEGYGPAGVALYLNILTDNKNRTVAEIRHLLSKYGGNLGETGCVAWMFEKKGTFVYNKSEVDEEKLMEYVLDAGAEDISEEESTWVVMTDHKDFYTVKEEIDKIKDLPLYIGSEITMIPQNTVKVVGKEAEQVLRLMDALEDCEDVQNAYANFDIPETELEKLG